MALKMQMNHSHAFQKGQKCRLNKKCDHFWGAMLNSFVKQNLAHPAGLEF